MALSALSLARRRRQVLAAVVAFGATGALAAEVGDPVVSGERDGKPQDVFDRNTPTVYVRAPLSDLPANATLSCIFIAENTRGVAPPDFRFGSADFQAGTLNNVLDCSLSMPSPYWPLGNYRVDIALDGKVVASATFSVDR